MVQNIREELEILIRKDAIASNKDLFAGKVTLVGCGQAGGVITKGIVKRFKKDGIKIDSVYINTSQEDLEGLGVTDAKNIFKFAGGEGAAQQGRETMNLIKANESDFMAFVDRRLKNEVLIFVTSTCGGSGSIISTYLANALSDSDKIISMVAVTPNGYEGVTMKSNNYRFFDRCTKIEGLGAVMAFDNNKGTIKAINEEIAEKVFYLLQMSDGVHENFNIDKKELKTALSTQGIMLVGLPNKCDIETLQDSLESRIFSLDNDTSYSRVLISATSDTEYLLLEDIKDVYGNYVSAFKGINEKQIVVCLSGFKYPLDKLNVMGEEINEELSDIKKQRSKIKKELNSSMFDFDFETQSGTTKKENKKGVFDDLDLL